MSICTTYKLLLQLEYTFYLKTLLFVGRNMIILAKSLFCSNHTLLKEKPCNWEQKVENCIIPIWTEGVGDVHLQENVF